MYIDENDNWNCSNCDFSGSYNDVKKHEKAVEVAKEYFENIKQG